MRYLITTKDSTPFLTNVFDIENNYEENNDMVVYDLHNAKYIDHNKVWMNISFDIT